MSVVLSACVGFFWLVQGSVRSYVPENRVRNIIASDVILRTVSLRKMLSDEFQYIDMLHASLT